MCLCILFLIFLAGVFPEEMQREFLSQNQKNAQHTVRAGGADVVGAPSLCVMFYSYFFVEQGDGQRMMRRRTWNRSGRRKMLSRKNGKRRKKRRWNAVGKLRNIINPYLFLNLLIFLLTKKNHLPQTPFDMRIQPLQREKFILFIFFTDGLEIIHFFIIICEVQ
jgi:hypothetical protein